MQKIAVSFPSGNLTLEGVLYLPEGEGSLFLGVVMCHPHPLNGGNMDNGVVESVCGALARNSFAALKFNFRGVGCSQGEHDNGRGEQEDVSAAVSFILGRDEVASGGIGLAGYSAGAGYSWRIGQDDARVKALALVSPPLEMFDFAGLADCRKPKFLISGSRDRYTSEGQFRQFCEGLPEPKEYRVVQGAGHFWVELEETVAGEITAFFVRELTPPAFS